MIGHYLALKQLAHMLLVLNWLRVKAVLVSDVT